MKLVLLSGGSGQRLWPLSHEARPKQFLNIFKNEYGHYESMVQRVWRQLKAAGLADCTYIATNTSQQHMMNEHIGKGASLLIEPQGKDTFAAIAMAASYFHSVLECDPDETVCVMPVDPFVYAPFYQKIKDTETILKETDADLVLIGTSPTYPSEKYGYIVPADLTIDTSLPISPMKVNHFVEKPAKAEAEQLIKQQALWNCGVFTFKLRYLMTILQEKELPLIYDDLIGCYDKLPETSFDYEVVEKAKRILMVPYYGYWKDLGTWNTVTEQMDIALVGKGFMSEDCHNTHLINESNIPVAILGLSNIVVVVGPNGMLVSDKSASHRIKEIINKLEK